MKFLLGGWKELTLGGVAKHGVVAARGQGGIYQ